MEQMDTDQNGFVEWEEYLEFSAKTMLSPRGHLATSETELALHMLLMHCDPRRRPQPRPRLRPKPGRREDNVMLDVEGIISLFRVALVRAAQRGGIVRGLRKQIDPHGRGRVR